MLPIKFVTDSAADIPRALREELGIQVLPFPIAMGNKELQDGYDFTPEEFPPTPSSTPLSSASAFRRRFRRGAAA